MDKLSAKTAAVSLLGEAIIPQGTTEILPRAFAGNSRLRSVLLPGTVKKVWERAFADCVNLKRVELSEGIECLDPCCFFGCTGLRELVLPDSLRCVDGALNGLDGLAAPVYNASRTVLYRYPPKAPEKTFTVPAGVRRIHTLAFDETTDLEELIVPEGVEEVATRAFLNCRLRRIFFPKSLKVIEKGAFFRCRTMEGVLVPGAETVIEDGAFLGCPWDMQLLAEREPPRLDERLHMFGRTILRRIRLEEPDGAYCRERAFLDRAERCALGDADAMWQMGEYFTELGDQVFYICAANFWRYRAMQRGSEAARAWFEQWLREHPDQAIPSILDETLSGEISGRILHCGGFLFFDPERKYYLDGVGRDGIVEVSAWCGDDGPDEDGYGREEYYDWWFLSENLAPIPGVEVLHDYSSQDRRADAKRFDERRRMAARWVCERR